MTFLHPEFLYLMIPPLLLLFYFLLTQREGISEFFSEEVYERLTVRSKRMSLKSRNLLFFLMFLCFIIALSQPVVEEGKVKVQAKSADIMIALDISDSMRAEDVYPSRLERGKQKILDLLALSPQERLGVIAFARASYLVAPLSFDHRAVDFLVRQLRPAFITEKGTDFVQLLRSAGSMLAENEEKYLLILTDGGDGRDFDEEIALARSEGIKVFVLGIGTGKGAPIKSSEGGFVKHDGSIVVTTLNEAVASLATQTGGVYIESVASGEDIRTMFAEMTAKTRKRTLKEEEITRYIQLFYYPLGAGMILLLLATSSMSRRESVHLPLSLLFAALLLGAPQARAGLLDFRLLDAANEHYAAEAYEQSSEAFEAYAKAHPSPEAYYDLGNSRYKAGDYGAAARAYRKVQTTDADLQASALYNLGNSYARQGDDASLEKALEAYDKSLALKEDPDVKANRELVEAAIKKRKKKESSPQSGEQPQDSKPGSQGQKGQKNGSNGASQQQNGQGQESPSRQDEGQQKGANSGPRDAGTKKSGSEPSPSQAGEHEAQEASAKAGTPQAPESVRSKPGEKPGGTEAAAAAEGAPTQEKASSMSDLEAQKWLQHLSERPVSHVYRIGGETSSEESEEANEKPW